jgi:hypothetical protein
VLLSPCILPVVATVAELCGTAHLTAFYEASLMRAIQKAV